MHKHMLLNTTRIVHIYIPCDIIHTSGLLTASQTAHRMTQVLTALYSAV